MENREKNEIGQNDGELKTLCRIKVQKIKKNDKNKMKKTQK